MVKKNLRYKRMATRVAIALSTASIIVSGWSWVIVGAAIALWAADILVERLSDGGR